MSRRISIRRRAGALAADVFELGELQLSLKRGVRRKLGQRRAMGGERDSTPRYVGLPFEGI
jgi:hypothetical protein